MRKSVLFTIIAIITVLIIPTFALLPKEKMQVDINNISSNTIQASQSSQNESINSDNSENESLGEDTVSVYFHKEGKVQSIPMLEYVTGVVLSEIPASFSEEAIKAQAIIAHTYTLKMMERESNSPTESIKGADISTDYTIHQGFCSEEEYKKNQGKNFEENFKKISTCVEEVFDQILTYEDEPILATFHAMSSGKTESAKNVWGTDIPYLIPTESEGDLLSPSYDSSLNLTKAEVENLISKAYPDAVFNDEPSSWFSVVSKTDSGYVDEIKLLNLKLTGQDIRSLFSLRSADFDVTYSNNIFTFEVFGYGHGVGLSQYGADYLARQGETYKEILSHYYPNTTLKKI